MFPSFRINSYKIHILSRLALNVVNLHIMKQHYFFKKNARNICNILNNKNNNRTQDKLHEIANLCAATQNQKRYFELLLCILTKLRGDLSSE